MTWQIALALFIAAPVLVIPAVFIWYMNIGGLYSTVKEARAKRTALKDSVPEPIESRSEEER